MMTNKIKHLTIHVTVTADTYSNGVFSFSDGTKEITLEEICRSIKELRKSVADPTKDWEVILTDSADGSEIITKHCSATDSYHVILP